MSFEEAVKKRLAMCEVARKWYIRYHETILTYRELLEFEEDVKRVESTSDEIRELMNSYYIEHLKKELNKK